MAATAEELVNKAKECGYDKCGIIRAGEMAGYAEKLEQREERFPEARGEYEKFRAFAAPLEYVESCNVKPCPDGCSLCVKACPSGSLAAPYNTNIKS